ncbi:MAG: sporulation protein YunB [Alkaliphilus sp.]|nr:MAG: sporulation protein YunB [Alkaliphilus sp.]
MFSRRKNKLRKYKVLISFTLLFAVLIYVFMYIDREIMPTVLAIGELRAQEITTRAINQSIAVVLKQSIDYEDLISIKKDNDGNITLMQANTMLMNKVASDVALTIQDHFSKIKTTSERIPLGNALGSQLLAQHGPKIELAITPLGMVNVNFGTEFEHSGINQTRHRIYLIIHSTVRVIVPFSSNTIEVTTYVPIAETIIVGRVPVNYVNVPRNEMMNIVPLYEETK